MRGRKKKKVYKNSNFTQDTDSIQHIRAPTYIHKIWYVSFFRVCYTMLYKDIFIFNDTWILCKWLYFGYTSINISNLRTINANKIVCVCEFLCVILLYIFFPFCAVSLSFSVKIIFFYRVQNKLGKKKCYILCI